MSDTDDPSRPTRRKRPPAAIAVARSPSDGPEDPAASPPEKPKVIYLELQDLACLPPDDWFEDAHGEAEMRREAARREARLARR